MQITINPQQLEQLGWIIECIHYSETSHIFRISLHPDKWIEDRLKDAIIMQQFLGLCVINA